MPVPAKPFIPRAAIAQTLLSVVCVLGFGYWAEIGLAIVEAIVIDMIDERIIGDLAYFAVHIEAAFLALCGDNRANRVAGQAASGGKPFVFGKPKEVVRIDEGVFALGQQYPAERIAVPEPPIQEHRLDNDPDKPERDGDGELNLAAPPQCE